VASWSLRHEAPGAAPPGGPERTGRSSGSLVADGSAAWIEDLPEDSLFKSSGNRRPDDRRRDPGSAGSHAGSPEQPFAVPPKPSPALAGRRLGGDPSASFSAHIEQLRRPAASSSTPRAEERLRPVRDLRLLPAPPAQRYAVRQEIRVGQRPPLGRRWRPRIKEKLVPRTTRPTATASVSSWAKDAAGEAAREGGPPNRSLPSGARRSTTGRSRRAPGVKLPGYGPSPEPSAAPRTGSPLELADLPAGARRPASSATPSPNSPKKKGTQP